MDAVKFLELFTLDGILRRLCRFFFFLDDLLADIFDVVLMLLLELLIDFFFDAFLDVLARAFLGDALRQQADDLRQVLFARCRMNQGILIEDALQRQHAFAAVRRTQQLHRIEPACLYDKRIRADEVDEGLIQGIDFAVDGQNLYWCLLGLLFLFFFLFIFMMEKTV